MVVLGLQGSPRTDGNTSALLAAFLDEAQVLGAEVMRVDVSQKKITPCEECGTCERKGFCPIKDDMQALYVLFRRADLVVMATPVFFYGPTAQMKAVIDRAQALWARRYVHKLADPGCRWRRGFLLSLGATKGKNLFDGVNLTAKYFFDAIGASFAGSLTFRRIEHRGEIATHPTAIEDARRAARDLAAPLLGRRKVLFASEKGACLAPMAGAFLRDKAGGRIEARSAGVAPAKSLEPMMQTVMAEKGLDMAFLKPESLAETVARGMPDLVITLGQQPILADLSGVPVRQWHLPEAGQKSLDDLRRTRDQIEEKVDSLLESGILEGEGRARTNKEGDL